jgi:GNAT superfamily N-acetyltransferase
MRRVEADIRQPSLCTGAEIAAFCDLVRQGEEVDPRGLEDRAKRAKALVLLFVDRTLAGVAALKRPARTYRDGVFQKAGVPNAAKSFDLELGWVFVPKVHRGKQYSRVLSAAALSQNERLPTFATTRADNMAMQRTLEHLAFRRLGDSWRSSRGKREWLVLYVSVPGK